MVPLIDRSPVAFSNRIAGMLKPRIHFKDEYVFTEHSTPDNMYAGGVGGGGGLDLADHGRRLPPTTSAAR